MLLIGLLWKNVILARAEIQTVTCIEPTQTEWHHECWDHALAVPFAVVMEKKFLSPSGWSASRATTKKIVHKWTVGSNSFCILILWWQCRCMHTEVGFFYVSKRKIKRSQSAFFELPATFTHRKWRQREPYTRKAWINTAAKVCRIFKNKTT